MITKFIVILVLTFGVIMIGGPIFIDSDSVYGAISKSTVKGGLVGGRFSLGEAGAEALVAAASGVPNAFT